MPTNDLNATSLNGFKKKKNYFNNEQNAFLLWGKYMWGCSNACEVGEDRSGGLH